MNSMCVQLTVDVAKLIEYPNDGVKGIQFQTLNETYDFKTNITESANSYFPSVCFLMEGGKWMNDSSIHHNLPEGPFHFIAVSFTCKRHHDRWVWGLRKCFNESGIASVSLTSSIMNIQSQCGMTLAAWKWRILLHLWDFTCLSSGCWLFPFNLCRPVLLIIPRIDYN